MGEVVFDSEALSVHIYDLSANTSLTVHRDRVPPKGGADVEKMCSVFDCDSWRRNALRFPLPEDTDRRLKWVQFLFEVNEQRFKESSGNDITICVEHFDEDCYFRAFPAGTLRLMSGATPSLRTRAERKAFKEEQVMVDLSCLAWCEIPLEA